MFNEFIFVLQSTLVGVLTLGAALYGTHGLVAATCLFGVLSNLFVVKQITLFGLTATAADAFAVGALLGLNVLQEFYGKEITRKTIALNFICLVVYAVFAQLHLWLIPAATDSNQIHFMGILQHAPRIVVASIAAYVVAQLFDYFFYGFLRRITNNKFYLMRTYIAIIASQLVDTVLFGVLGLYGIVENLGQVMLVSYLIKLIVIALATPMVSLAKKFIRVQS
jgi:queuosine precursor transporter